MRSLSLSLLTLMVAMPVVSAYATGITDSPAPTPVSAPSVQPVTAPAAPTPAPAPAATEESMTLTAAPTPTPVDAALSSVAGSSLGEYKSVSCNSNSAFAVNNCDQCFDGGSVKVGVRLTGLFDNWTNSTTSPLTAYRDEQKTPNMVRFGNTTWATTPASEAGIWKYSSDVVWSGTGSKASFILSPGSKVKFFEADLNAGYTLEKTDKKNGELIGLLRFPVVSRVTNIQTATEGAPNTHYECVAYKLDAPAPVVETPKPVDTPPPATPAPPPEKMTQTETGPETLLLIAAAFFIAFGLMFTLRKRV